jgi:hypothetical protein
MFCSIPISLTVTQVGFISVKNVNVMSKFSRLGTFYIWEHLPKTSSWSRNYLGAVQTLPVQTVRHVHCRFHLSTSHSLSSPTSRFFNISRDYYLSYEFI